MARLGRRILALCIAISPAWAAAQTVQSLPDSRTYLNAQIYVENNALHIEKPKGQAVQPLDDWKVPGKPVGRLIGLVRADAAGTQVRIVDGSGMQVGAGAIPPDRVPIVSDNGFVTLVETLHNVVRPHDLAFYSLNGALLRKVSDPNLSIAKWFPQGDGRMVTVNQGPAPDDRAIIVYAADGRVLWRYDWKGTGVPDVAITPDGQRLVLLQPDVLTGTAELAVLNPGNQVLQLHRLPNLNQFIVSDDSQRIAAAGQSCAVLVDAKSGRLVWRKDADIDLLLPGGLRFDPSARHLMIVAAKRDLEAGVGRMSLRRLDLTDGTAAFTDLGNLPLGEAPPVLDIGRSPSGNRRVQLHDRIVDVPMEH